MMEQSLGEDSSSRLGSTTWCLYCCVEVVCVDLLCLNVCTRQCV